MKGKCWKFGNNINTDEIIPARYLNTTDTKELASHCMEDADPNFIKKAKREYLIILKQHAILINIIFFKFLFKV